jgi:hypothetical protein
MRSGGTILSVIPCGNSRSCIYFSSQTHALLLLELSSKDVTMVRITYKMREPEGTYHYFSIFTLLHRWTITKQGHERCFQLLQEPGRATHHWLWHGMHTTLLVCGEALALIRKASIMEYVVSLKLNILNQGNKHTFVIHKMKEVTDVY